MLVAPLRWLGKNVGTLFLAFVLAVVAWVSAVVNADPNEEHIYRPVTIDLVNLDSNLLVVGDTSTLERVTLEAPRSIWTQLNNSTDQIQALVDLSGLGAGKHTVQVKIKVGDDIRPYRIITTDPKNIQVTLEPLISRTMPIQLKIDGDPPLGYTKGDPTANPAQVAVSGAQSLVSQVSIIRASLNISGASETVKNLITLEALDKKGDPVENVTISPKIVTVIQPINLLGGYKNVFVKVTTSGQVAKGYRLTNISVSPNNVTVFSSNPQLVNELPGYVETLPVDLNNLNDDKEFHIALNLPPEISLVGEQSVVVQVGVAAIQGSLTISLPLEASGLPPQLEAHFSPPTVDVIVSGPLPVLDTLSPSSFRAVVNLTGLDLGVYTATPVIDLIPAQVSIQTMLPQTVSVTIAPAPTPTPTPLNGLHGPGAPTTITAIPITPVFPVGTAQR